MDRLFYVLDQQTMTPDDDDHHANHQNVPLLFYIALIRMVASGKVLALS
jgi:hypothetical protein